jgi:hypothetical protein
VALSRPKDGFDSRTRYQPKKPHKYRPFRKLPPLAEPKCITAEEKRRPSWTWQLSDTKPAGKLSIEVSALGLKGKRKWTEGEGRSLEEVIGIIIGKLEAVFCGFEARRKREAEWAKQRAEAAQREAAQRKQPTRARPDRPERGIRPGTAGRNQGGVGPSWMKGPGQRRCPDLDPCPHGDDVPS